MFFGGLNGDGFFGEEYEGPHGNDGDGSDGGYYGRTKRYTPENLCLKHNGISLTGVETQKALMLRQKYKGKWTDFWMPKSCMVLSEFIDGWAIKIYKENLKTASIKLFKKEGLTLDDWMDAEE